MPKYNDNNAIYNNTRHGPLSCNTKEHMTKQFKVHSNMNATHYKSALILSE
jgi:hypothetical protein